MRNLNAVMELWDVLLSWSGQKSDNQAQSPTFIPPVSLPRVRSQKLLDVSKNLGALRVIPKESSQNIPLPIASPISSPSVSLPRVLKQLTRNLLPRVSRQPIHADGPIAAHTRSRKTIPVPVPNCEVTTVEEESIAHRTRSHQSNVAPSVSPSQAAQRNYPLIFLLDWAMPVLDEESGKTLEYGQLCKHPKYQKIWN